MAKLRSYYTLCPLIDQQSLLGVEKDAESGCAIVTLGRNIVIRYKLQDLKQVSSWSSKERLTSQVIYDKKTNSYTAIFNEKHIRVWMKEEVDLDKVKRYKFHEPFHAILSVDDKSPVLVRQDGATATLEWALDNRKTWTSKGILKANEKLFDCKLIEVNNQNYLCVLTKIGAVHNYLIVGLDKNTYVENPEKINRIELKRKSEELVGHVVLQDKNNAYLVTLWSHGRLYSYPLTGPCADPAPGMLVSVFSSISTNNPVVMVSLNESTIAAYGADANEEGAVLLIFNLQFKLVQAISKLKLYTKDAKLWKIDDKLLLAANRHLAVVPYHLASQRIETLLGSCLRFKGHEKVKDEDNEVVEIQEITTANWGDYPESPSKLSTQGIPRNIAKRMNAFINEGTSDAAIQQALIPQLIESKDVTTILWCLNNFKDLPEKLLVDLLSLGLKISEEKSTPMQNGTADTEKNVTTKNLLLDRILSCNFSDISVLPYIKSALNFNDVLKLINYFIDKLSTEDTIDYLMEPDDKHLYEWASLLLDSHYQNYLLSQDPSVLALLNKLKELLDYHFQVLRDYQDLRPMLERIKRGKFVMPNRIEFNKFYSIEEIQLY